MLENPWFIGKFLRFANKDPKFLHKFYCKRTHDQNLMLQDFIVCKVKNEVSQLLNFKTNGSLLNQFIILFHQYIIS